MTTLNRLMTLLRGQLRWQAETVLDANALALLDQQLFDTEQGLIAARRDLAALMAERALAEKQQQQTRQASARYEDCAVRALQRGEETLAQDTASRVAELEQQDAALGEQIETLREREDEFRTFICEAGATLKTLRQQQALARVSERMQRSTQVLASGNSSLARNLEASRDTLSRIQQRQDQARAQWRASQALVREDAGEQLDRRLEQAGLLAGQRTRQQQVMARLQAKLGSMDRPVQE